MQTQTEMKTKKLRQFTEKDADCDRCPLQPEMKRRQTCYARGPTEPFNGIMIIGEGPGHREVALKNPFIGKAGGVLNWLLEQADIKREECYITNATLCKPPTTKDSVMMTAAVAACTQRLEAEIIAVRPQVIVTLGGPALEAITGRFETKTKREHFDCDNCNENRRVGPAIQCANGACKHIHMLKLVEVVEGEEELSDMDVSTYTTYTDHEVAVIRSSPCPECGSKRKGLRPKMVKCPKCDGLKMRSVDYEEFVCAFKVTKVAGAIFDPVDKDETDDTLQQHELPRWLYDAGVKYVVTTLHPAYLMRGQQFMAEPVVRHLTKAANLCRIEPKPYLSPHVVTTDPKVVRGYCYGWQAAGQDPATLQFDCDIETEAWGEHNGKAVRLDARKYTEVSAIKCLGIYDRSQPHALVVDTRDADDALLDTIYDFLADDRLAKCWQNGGSYDIPVIDKLWGIPWDQQIPSYRDDTLVLHHSLCPDEPHNLGHIALSFTDARAWKPTRKLGGADVHESFDELALYNARDVIHTGRSCVAMRAALGKAEVERVYENDMKLQRIAVAMTMHGMPLDQSAVRRAGVTAQTHINASLDRCQQLLREHTYLDNNAINNFNPAKLKASLIPALYSREGFHLPAIERTPTGEPSTAAGVLQKLLRNVSPEQASFIGALFEIREHRKILQNYIEGDAMRVWDDGRIHATWKPHGTRTGRFSSSPNFQNWPLWLRSYVKAPPGRKIVGADYAQLELRGIAAISGDENLISRCMNADESRKLEPEFDPHSYGASIAFDEAYTRLLLDDPAHDKANEKCHCETCKRKALRDLFKRVIYGLNYGATAPRIWGAIYEGGYNGPPITLLMVERVMKAVFRAFPKIPLWRMSAVEAANRDNEIRSPILGRRRVFPLGEIPDTEVYNFPIQSMGADIMNPATIDLYEYLPDIDPTAMIIAQVHDALYVECAENCAQGVADLLEEVMTQEHVLVKGAAPMLFPATAVISDTWKNAS